MVSFQEVLDYLRIINHKNIKIPQYISDSFIMYGDSGSGSVSYIIFAYNRENNKVHLTLHRSEVGVDSTGYKHEMNSHEFSEIVEDVINLNFEIIAGIIIHKIFEKVYDLMKIMI